MKKVFEFLRKCFKRNTHVPNRFLALHMDLITNGGLVERLTTNGQIDRYAIR